MDQKEREEKVAQTLGIKGIVQRLNWATGKMVYDAGEFLYKDGQNNPATPVVAGGWDELGNSLMDDAVEVVVALKLIAERLDAPFEGVLMAADTTIEEMSKDISKVLERIQSIE